MTTLAPPARASVGLRLRSWTRWAGPLLGIAALLLLWQLIAVTIAAGHHVVPTVPDVLASLRDNNFYLVHLRATLWEAARGFLWGNLAAFAVAAVCVVIPPLRDALTRVAMTTYCTPTIAIAPLLAVLFSPDQSKVTMAALSVFFPTFLGSMLGLQSAPRGALEFAHVSGASPVFVLWRIQLRAAVGPVLGALSLAAPAALVGAIIGEYLGGDTGLGVQLVQAQQSLEIDKAWAVAIEATAVSTAAYLLIGLLARRLAYHDTSTDIVGFGQPSGPRAGRRARLVQTLTAAGLFVALWYAFTAVIGDDYLAKPPHEVIAYLARSDATGIHGVTIGWELLETLRDASVGYLAGTIAAIVVAWTFLASRVIEGMFLPVAMTLQAVPLVAMTPVIALVFGRGVASVAVLAGAVTFVPTLVMLLAALRAVPRPALDLAHVYALGPIRTTAMRFVYALPALAASARIALPGSILGAVLVEILATGTGIGYLISRSISNSAYLQLWAALVVLSVVTAVLYTLLSALETATTARLMR